MLNPFTVLSSINFDKKDLLEDRALEREYPAFMVNRGLSYFPDTILYANEMNGTPHIDNKLQYDFYLYGIKKRKRFSKWSKKDPQTNTIRMIMDYYKISERKALETISILNQEQLDIIETRMYKGGKG